MNKQLEKIKCHQGKNMGHYGVKPEMIGEKKSKTKPKKPCLLFMPKYYFKITSAFFASWNLKIAPYTTDGDIMRRDEK